MKPTNFCGFQTHDLAGFMLKSGHFRCFKTAIISWFHLVVSARKVLAELDFTVSEIQRGTEIIHDGQRVLTPYDHHQREKSPVLFDNNYVLQGIDKTTFIEQEDSVYEVRLDENLGLLEVFYKTPKAQNDGDFAKQALRTQTKLTTRTP